MKKSKKNAPPSNAAANILFGTARAPSPSPVPESVLLQQALAWHQQNNFGAAESNYAEILRRNPNNVIASNFLGLLKYQTGDAVAALQHLSHALGCDPGFAPAWNNQGMVLRKLGRFEEAIQSYQRALNLKADYLEACLNLVNVLRDAGKLSEALQQIERCQQIRPDLPQTLNAKGAVLNDLGQAQAALRCLEMAIALSPDLASAYFNRGNAYAGLGNDLEAIKSYEESLKRDPFNATTLNSLACLQLDLRRFDAAIANLMKAVQIHPQFFDAHINLANAYDELGRYPQALVQFNLAVQAATEAQMVAALVGRGLCLASMHRYENAADDLRAALTRQPEFPLLKGYLWDTYRKTLTWDLADKLAAEIDRALEQGELAIQPFSYLALSSDAARQLKCATAYFNHQYGSDNPRTLMRRSPSKEDKIRVAYVSADLREHAVAKLMIEVLVGHERNRFEIFVVSLAKAPDDPVQQGIQKLFDEDGHFCDATLYTDDQVVQWMHDKYIDIAVDLMGYTLGSRPGIFAKRTAPVQVNMLGYAGTLGASAWDYIVGDRYVTPPDLDKCYAEKVARLPRFFAPISSSEVDKVEMTRQELGLPNSGFVFCCFNNVQKITLSVFSTWMRVLFAVPDSVLWLRCDDPALQTHLQRMATTMSIEPGRILFAARVSETIHRARMKLADLFLDTFPYNAHSTAIEALGAGLPLLTFSGESFASRVAGSLLHHAGVPELVASSWDDYEEKAIFLAQHPGELEALRTKVLTSESVRGPASNKVYVDALEAAYVQMAENGRAGRLPVPLDL